MIIPINKSKDNGESVKYVETNPKLNGKEPMPGDKMEVVNKAGTTF